jgi:hypothetical protein
VYELMMDDFLFPSLAVHRKTGKEPFCDGMTPLDFDLLSFWQWSASDLTNNALRGRLAEFLVAQALGLADGVRVEWDAVDLRTPNGLAIEVKSAAYLQSWSQRALSAIRFTIATTRHWDAETNKLAAESRRQADLYVFALLTHQDKTTLDPMDVSQWEFLLLPADVLNRQLPEQKQLSLSALLRLNPTRCTFDNLRKSIKSISEVVTYTDLAGD